MPSKKIKLQIVIPSKGRPGKVETLSIFKKATLFVEPSEAQAYAKAYPKNKIVVLDKNNGGMAYVRNYILNYYADQETLVLDDDVNGIFKREKKKLIRIKDPKPLIDSLCVCLKKGYKQATISYKPSNWMFEGLYKINTRCWCFMAMAKPTALRFDEDLGAFCDYDYTAQLIHEGFKNISLYSYAFECATMGSNTGGCQTLVPSRKERSKAAKDYLIRKWGPHVITSRYNKNTKIEEVQFRWQKIR